MERICNRLPVRMAAFMRFEIGDMDFRFGFDTPALVYDKGGGFNRSAHSAWPALNDGKWEMGNRKWEIGNGKSEMGNLGKS